MRKCPQQSQPGSFKRAIPKIRGCRGHRMEGGSRFTRTEIGRMIFSFNVPMVLDPSNRLQRAVPKPDGHDGLPMADGSLTAVTPVRTVQHEANYMCWALTKTLAPLRNLLQR